MLLTGNCQLISMRANVLTFGSPFSAMALSHWMTLSVCLKWRPVACRRKAEHKNERQKMYIFGKANVPCWQCKL